MTLLQIMLLKTEYYAKRVNKKKRLNCLHQLSKASSVLENLIHMKVEDTLNQRCTTFLGQGPQCIIFSALEGRRQNY